MEIIIRSKSMDSTIDNHDIINVKDLKEFQPLHFFMYFDKHLLKNRYLNWHDQILFYLSSVRKGKGIRFISWSILFSSL